MRLKNTLIAMALMATAAVSLPAAAANLDYTYVEAGFVQTRVDGLGELTGSDNLNGWGANASFGLPNGVILFGGYGAQSRDVSIVDSGIDGNVDLDLSNWRVGAGYAFPVGERADWVTKLAYESPTLDIDADGTYDDGTGPVPVTINGSAEANAWTLETGIRGRLTERLDGYLGAGYVRMDDPSIGDIQVDGDVIEGGTVDLDDLGADRSEAFGVVGAHFELGAGWGVVGQAMVSSDLTQYFVGLRASL